MSFFVREIEVERWLESMVRDVQAPEGGTIPIRMSRLAWKAYDELMEYECLSPQRLVAAVRADAAEKGITFEILFPEIVGYLNRPRGGRENP